MLIQTKIPKINKKRTLIGCGLLFFLLILLVIILATCLGGGKNSTRSTQIYTGPEVLYEITGTTALVDVTLSNASGGIEQYSNAQVPSHYRFDNFPNYYLYISAQNQVGAGTVTVSIYVNGKLYKTSTSSGAYVIATAYGSK
jgi:hypothetical protein